MADISYIEDLRKLSIVARLRLEVKDRLLVDEKKIKSSGAAGVIRPGKTAVQVVIGPKAWHSQWWSSLQPCL